MKLVWLEEISEITPDGTFRYEIMWNDDRSTGAPFLLSMRQKKAIESNYAPDLPFPYRIVWTKDDSLQYVAVRTDDYPIIWVWWWFVVRIEETLRLISVFLLTIAGIWGLSKVRCGVYASWRDDVWEYWRSRFKRWLQR